MGKRKSLSIFIIFTLFLCFNFVSCSSSSNSTPAAPLKVFTTSATGNGNLGSWTNASGKTGIAAADAICQAAATSAGLQGTYKAWISDSTTDAYCHIQGYDGHTISDNCGQTTLPVTAGPWVRTDGFPFGETINKIINNGVIYAPAAYDEKGNLVKTYNYDSYFTGTNYDGTKNAQTCSDWTSSSGSDNAFHGDTAGTTDWWSGGDSSTCDNAARLLCFQTGTGGSLPSITTPASAKKVFVTSVTGNGNLTTWADYSGSATGVAAGDTICQARATAAGLANAANFKAWLSDGSHNATDRITTDGPWYRLDGVKVADNKAALLATNSTSTPTPLFTGITYTETGAYVTADSYRVWTGTKPDGTEATSDCLDWSNHLNSNTGFVGDAHIAKYWWTSFTPLTCDQSAALYCFED